jgi:hypothetical protein
MSKRTSGINVNGILLLDKRLGVSCAVYLMPIKLDIPAV